MTSHWLLDTLVENRNLALRKASRSQIRRELLDEPFTEDTSLIRRTGEALEMVVLDLILEGTDKGILLRPAISVPIEIYTEERIAEFASDEDAIGDHLPDPE